MLGMEVVRSCTGFCAIRGRFLGLGLKTEPEGPTQRRRDLGASGSFEAEDTRRDRGACVGRTRGAVDAWLPDGDTYNFPKVPLVGVYLYLSCRGRIDIHHLCST